MLTRLAFHLICVMPVASARMLNGLSTRFSQIAADQRPGVTRRTNWRGRDRFVLDYRELLRRMAVNDARVAEDCLGADSLDPPGLDAKTLELVRLAALVAVGGAVPSYGAQADAAVNAGATADEIVDVLVGVVPIVGLPCAVAAAPKLALALGYDTDDE
jgi:4-carboxymuconolactone decarboxylase